MLACTALHACMGPNFVVKTPKFAIWRTPIVVKVINKPETTTPVCIKALN